MLFAVPLLFVEKKLASVEQPKALDGESWRKSERKSESVR